MDYVVQTVCGQGLRLSIVLDAQANPPWVFDVVPDAGVVDSKGIGHRSISFNHPAVMQLVHLWYDAVLARLQQLNSTCVHSIQPCFNNEYETKYIQVGGLAGSMAAAAPTWQHHSRWTCRALQTRRQTFVAEQEICLSFQLVADPNSSRLMACAGG